MKVPASLLFAFFLAVGAVVPQETAAQTANGALDESFGPEVTSFSGTPLLLEIETEKPPAGLKTVVIEAPGSRMEYDVARAAPGDGPAHATGPSTRARPDDDTARAPAPSRPHARPGEGAPRSRPGAAAGRPYPPDTPLTLRVSPFLAPGIYDLEVRLSGAEGTSSSSYEVGFAEFVWGRDNFRFGNNASYESRIGDYSRVLRSWLEERFTEVTDVEHAVLVHYMYGLFGTNAGRCYAFTGSQLRYRRTPDRLPRYYDTIYDVRESNRLVQREMHYLQLDIVFEEFVSTAGDPENRAALAAGQALYEQSRGELLAELRRIRAGIEEGSPVAVGFLAPDLHHSMLVYGYIYDLARRRVDLIVANNWKEEQSSNLASRDAEVVRIDFSYEDPAIAWISREGPRRRTPDRLFVVEVKDEYDHERAPLSQLVHHRLAALRADGKRSVVVEGAEEAWIEDGDGNYTGRRRNRTRVEIDSVSSDRVQESFAFEYPGERHLRLSFVDDENDEEAEGVRVFHVRPGADEGASRAWTLDTRGLDPPEADEGDEPVWSVELDPNAGPSRGR